MKEKTMYETADGETFESRYEAEEHEKRLNVTDQINAYLNREFPDLTGRARSRVVNTLLRWEMRVLPCPTMLAGEAPTTDTVRLEDAEGEAA